MVRALDEIVGKIPAVDGANFMGIGRMNFISGANISLEADTEPGAPGVPTTVNITINGIGTQEALAALGLSVTPVYDGEDLIGANLGGVRDIIGQHFSANSLYAFNSNWLQVQRKSAGGVHSVVVRSPEAEGAYAGQRVSLAAEFDVVGTAVAGVLQLGDFALLRKADGTPAVMGAFEGTGESTESGSGRTYVFDLLLDMSLITGGGAVTKSVARATVVAWVNANSHFVSSEIRVVDLVGEGQAYSWTNATFTPVIVSTSPRLTIDFDLSALIGTYPDIRARVSVKHSHTHRPE